jgi:hypothetical protein
MAAAGWAGSKTLIFSVFSQYLAARQTVKMSLV